MREFVLSENGIRLIDVYVGPGGVRTGAERLMQEARDMQAEKEREEETERRKREFQAKKIAVEAQVAVMMSELSAQEKELERLIEDAAAEKKEAQPEAR